MMLCGMVVMGGAESGARPPDRENVAYGPHARQVLDFWQAPGAGPRPLIVHIHGGGWTQGDKTRTANDIEPFLARGISYASIAYRLTGEAPLPAPVHDAARAVQFLRLHAAEWAIDPERIALTGGSAGGCSALWIALHDDLADPDADEPVLRESTRIRAAAVSNAQTSIDPEVIAAWLGPVVLNHRMIWTSVGEPDRNAALARYEQYRGLYTEFSPINHLTPDDPPIMLVYTHPADLPPANTNHAIHHPRFGKELKDRSDRIGHECHWLVHAGPRASRYDRISDFLIDKLKAGP